MFIKPTVRWLKKTVKRDFRHTFFVQTLCLFCYDEGKTVLHNFSFLQIYSTQSFILPCPRSRWRMWNFRNIKLHCLKNNLKFYKNQACKGWSWCNGICLAFSFSYIWLRNQTFSVASARAVTGSVFFMQKFWLFLGQCGTLVTTRTKR